MFDHYLFHEGSDVKQGVKYAVRSDVFYTPLSNEELEVRKKERQATEIETKKEKEREGRKK